MMSHQDWNKITLNNTVHKNKKGQQAVQEALRRGNQVESIRRTSGSNRQNVPTFNPRQLSDDSDVLPVAELTHQFRMAMQRARVENGLSQADLAKRINQKQSIVNDYESGRAIPNPQIISKLERSLNCRLPRPKKQQIK